MLYVAHSSIPYLLSPLSSVRLLIISPILSDTDFFVLYSPSRITIFFWVFFCFLSRCWFKRDTSTKHARRVQGTCAPYGECVPHTGHLIYIEFPICALYGAHVPRTGHLFPVRGARSLYGALVPCTGTYRHKFLMSSDRKKGETEHFAQPLGFFNLMINILTSLM